MKRFNVAVVGATGAVGQEMIKVLEERNFPVKNLKLLASEKSIGKYYSFKNKTFNIDALNNNSFKDIEIALFSAGGTISERYAPQAVHSGAVVIDNTSAFRMDKNVPLVVPEVNPHSIKNFNVKKIIANPNCSTIQLVVVLKPIMDAVGLERVVVSTFQSVSGAGLKAMEELSKQSIALFSSEEIEIKKFPHQIAFNIIPHIDVFMENGYTKEEMKMINETKKIMETELNITATCTRVPVFYGHSESCNIQTKEKISVLDLKNILSKAKGVAVMDNVSKNEYPMPIHVAGRDDVFVGRIREDLSVKNGINLWIVADNIRKGAALNAVQIAEILVEKYL